MDDKALKALIAETQKTLADFLKADVKLGLTFAQVAQTEAAAGDTPAAIRAVKKAVRSVDTAERFLPIAVGLSRPDRKQIESNLAKLKERLAELEVDGT